MILIKNREKLVLWKHCNKLLLLLLLLFVYLLQLSFHPVAVVLTIAHTKQIRINIRKRNNKKHSTNKIKQNTINTSTHVTKKATHKHTHTHTLQNKLKQPQYKIHTKWNSHNIIKYSQYEVTLIYKGQIMWHSKYTRHYLIICLLACDAVQSSSYSRMFRRVVETSSSG